MLKDIYSQHVEFIERHNKEVLGDFGSLKFMQDLKDFLFTKLESRLAQMKSQPVTAGARSPPPEAKSPEPLGIKSESAKALSEDMNGDSEGSPTHSSQPPKKSADSKQVQS